mgnify:CR=1 FL=1
MIGGTIVGEICHIQARRRKGPRYNPDLTLAERNEYKNLLLLCRTCHKLVDSDVETYTVEYLTELKSRQDREGGVEMDAELRTLSEVLIAFCKPKRAVKASANDGGMAVAVGGDNHGSITLNQAAPKPAKANVYADNSIGADANMSGYIDYLFGLGVDYWKGVNGMNAGRLGKKIKRRFRLKARTRNHLSVNRFDDLAGFMIREILAPSPVGKRHRRNGTKLCRTFDEYRNGSM